MTARDDGLAAYRAEFPIFARKVYLNTCSLGPLSRRSRAAVNEFLDLWDELGAAAWYELWWGALRDLRERFARLVGAGTHEVALAASVSAALTAIASSLDYRERNRVVIGDLDFPTVGYQWLAKRDQDVEVLFARSPDRVGIPLEHFARLVDRRTALVATSRVAFTSGYVQDVRALAALAHEHGALLCVDDYHGTGQLPIDVKEAGVDVLISGGLKWLLGGPGLAYLYVREELIPRLRPSMTGWFAHENQFSFEIENLTFARDATRFQSGTPALAAVYAGRAGLEIVEEIGPARLRAATSALSADLIRRAQQAGYTVRSPLDDERRAGIVAIAMDDPASAVAHLAHHDVIVDARAGLLRISPYFYNTPEDNERLIGILQAR